MAGGEDSNAAKDEEVKLLMAGMVVMDEVMARYIFAFLFSLVLYSPCTHIHGGSLRLRSSLHVQMVVYYLLLSFPPLSFCLSLSLCAAHVRFPAVLS